MSYYNTVAGPRLHSSKNRSDMLPPPLPFHFYSSLLLSPSPSYSSFFLLFVGVLRPDQYYLPLRYASVHLPLCCAVHLPPWPLILFTGCVFALNKSFLHFRSVIMGNLYDENYFGVRVNLSWPL